MFQSPSLRGSGRFLPPPKGGGEPFAGFNPLHCGAVVASSGRCGAADAVPQRFNPLHCGAVVASMDLFVISAATLLVSIPFIAGQWSLHHVKLRSPDRRNGRRFNPLHCGAVVASRIIFECPSPHGGCFNPLHCGAVVASSGWRLVVVDEKKFQSPSLRGSGRFSRTQTHHGFDSSRFQSPSLRGSGRFWRAWAEAGARAVGFNPLHCGAVVASPCRACA